jgi:hypothetical protein
LSDDDHSGTELRHWSNGLSAWSCCSVFPFRTPDGGNDRWRGPGGQDVAGTNVLVRHAYDAQNNGNATLLISNLNWDYDGWPRY